MIARRIQLLLLLALCAALYLGSRYAVRITPVHQGLETRIEGDFTEGGGWYEGEPFVTASPVRAWGSWSGGDEKTGTLQIGPFPAPLRLRIAVGGYPGRADEIQVSAVRLQDGARVQLKLSDVGERWRITEHDLPGEWRGQPITLQATDRAQGLGGWVSLTEPINGGRGEGPAGLLETLAAWSINGVLLGLLWLAAVRLLRKSGRVAESWIPLAGVAVVATGGYLLFWAYFAHPTLGQALSWGLVAAGPVILCLTREPKPGKRESEPDEARRVARLTITIGLLYLAILHLFPTSLDFYSLAANRFRPGLPSDNQLPFEAAERLVAGVPLRQAKSDWISSDRPPLQCGWELITWPVLAQLGVDPRAASGTAAVWFQLSWVAAAFGLLRALGLSSRRTAGWVAVIALAGFFLQNTTFTWPKLSAAAFACAAFVLWIHVRPGTQRRDDVLVGAGFAALAWLSHGGVAFSYLALAPWLIWRCCRGEWRLWILGALVFALFAAPWIAYQKYSDPPGNRLLKWHLAGHVPKDPRGTLETLRDSYRAVSWAEIWGHKRLNLATQIQGNWAGLLTVSPATAVHRRNQEFFFTARALTWWPLALLLLPLAWRPHLHGPGQARYRRLQLGLLAWTLATLLVWCGLMFTGGSAVIHQGSYAVMLAAFVLCSAWFEAAGRRWLAVIGTLQAVTLASTWVPPTHVVFGELSLPAFLLGIAATAALAGWIIQAYRDHGDAQSGDGRIAASATDQAPEQVDVESPTSDGTSSRLALIIALGLAALSALSALTFARGVLTGAAIAGVIILGTLRTPLSWAQRTRVILACLGPAMAMAMITFLVSAGNHRALGGHGAEMVAFALSYWAAAALQRLLEPGPWELQPVIALGLLKLALIVWAMRTARARELVVRYNLH